MLTVKHIRSLDSAEAIDFADRVLWYPNDTIPTTDQSATCGGRVTLVRPGSLPMIDINDGTVYVMNDHGSTIAKYVLGLPHYSAAA